MSILIKGMEMPKSCWHCEFCRDGFDEYAEHYDYCVALDMNILISQTERHENCPLVEVPPHGRLIDADALKKRVQKLQEWLWDKLTDADVGIVTADDLRYRIAEESEEFIDDAPTIIESEELNG